MDKATARLVLESYRSRDADDPVFADALRAVAVDPELAAWFEKMQRFDDALTAKFQQTPVPADVKNHILLGYHAAGVLPVLHRRRTIVWLSSVAAAIVLGLICWRALTARPPLVEGLALEAISCTERMPALQFVCFDAGAVARWVNDQPCAKQIGFRLPTPDKSLSMKMIGSSVVEWQGKPVIMLCLQNNQRMAMLYILDPSAAPGLVEGASATVQKADWVVQAAKSDGCLHVLTTKGRPEDFQMPF